MMDNKAAPWKLYFYSNRNIVGTGLAIATAVLAAVGVVQEFWFLIVAGAYGAGALLTPGNSKINIELQREMSDKDIIARLALIAKQAQKALPPAIAHDVQEICETLTQALPLVAELKGAGSLSYDVRTTATEFLPQTLEAYTKMPPALRATIRIDDKNAAQMLADQIETLKIGLHDMMTNLAPKDMNKIAANGEFLRQKFTTPVFGNVNA
jgi:hypothetical protein